MSIRNNQKRKLKPKYASSVKKNPALKQAWDDGYRYGFNCYNPEGIGYGDIKLDFEFSEGFYAGLNGK